MIKFTYGLTYLQSTSFQTQWIGHLEALIDNYFLCSTEKAALQCTICHCVISY